MSDARVADHHGARIHERLADGTTLCGLAGTGAEFQQISPGFPVNCDGCQQLTYQWPAIVGERECSTCRGRGEVVREGHTCPTCGGTGTRPIYADEVPS